MVDPEHLEAPGNCIIPPDAPFRGPRFEGFEAIAHGVKEAAQGSLIIGQLSHPGRQVEESIQPHPISASAVQLVAPHLHKTYGVPRPATRDDITRVVEAFAHAAAYLECAGFDGAELHAAHGYLLAQFLSRTTNLRKDEYGGNLENRMRLVLDIAEAVRSRVRRSFVLGIKLNSIEFQDSAFTPEEASKVCEALEKGGVDFVELSGGTYEKFAFHHVKESTKVRENYFIEFAEQIVGRLKTIRVYVTGGFKTSGGMAKALDVVDGVGLASAACQEPRLPRDILSGKVLGVMKPALHDDTYFKRVMAAGCQIRQISKNQEPVNLTVPEKLGSLFDDFAALWRNTAQGEERIVGYPDLTQDAKPFLLDS